MVVSYLYDTSLVLIRFVQETKGLSGNGECWFETNHISTMILWALSSIANGVAIVVTVAYWTLLYNPDNQMSPLEVVNDFNIHLTQVSVLPIKKS